MPLPNQALVFYGGCNCRAIRYKIEIPELPSRPLNPLSNGQVHFPMVATDHCNDCRRAMGSILPTWMCVPATFMSISLRSARDIAPEIEKNGPWIPSMEALRPGPANSSSHLKLYVSSPNRTRTFCGNCGTNLTYSINPMIEGFPDIFDVVLGTFDKEYLEQDWMAPDRHCWWSCGIEWIKKLSGGGVERPRHPGMNLCNFVE